MPTIFRELLAILSPHYRRRLLYLELGAFAQSLLDAVAFGLLYPLLQLFTSSRNSQLSKAVQISGDLLRTHQTGQLELRLGVLIIILFVLDSACGIFLTYAQCHVSANSEAELSIRLFNEYLHVPYLEHIQRNSAELNRNVTPVVQDIHQNVLLSLLTIGGNVLTIAVIVIVIGIVNYFVTAMAVIYFASVTLLYGLAVSPRTRQAGREFLRISGTVYRATQEGFHGLKAFKASDNIDAVVEDFRVQRRALARYRYQILFYVTLPQYYMQGALIGGVIIFVVVIALTGVGDVTALVGLIVAASIRLMPCLYQILMSLNKIRSGQASVHEVYTDLQRLANSNPHQNGESLRQYESLGPPGNEPQWSFTQSVVFEQVSFRYPKATQDALTDASLVIPKGSSVAVVGPSGAGKTTVVDLLLGMFEPSRGRILIDGVALRGDMVNKWRSQVAYVPQEIFLIDGTICQNVLFDKGLKEVDNARVWQVLERAQIAELVTGLPEGIETVVGERGVRFSGGQRQRLGIARALYRQPSVLILDEATSALDTATEAAFAATVDRLRGELTLITVAHRLSTVRSCDNIFLMEGGHVVADGTFDELRRESELFTRMARLAHIESS